MADITPSMDEFRRESVNRVPLNRRDERQAQWDRAIAAHDAELRAEIAADLRNSCDVRDLDAPDVICHFCERAATIAEGKS